MLTSYQLDITDFYNTPIGHVKKLVPNFFLIKKGMCFIMKTLFKVRIKTTKKIRHVLEFNQSQWLKSYVEFRSVQNINEQCCRRSNNRKIEKQNCCQT